MKAETERERKVRVAREQELPSVKPRPLNREHYMLCSAGGLRGSPGCVCVRFVRSAAAEVTR